MIKIDYRVRVFECEGIDDDVVLGEKYLDNIYGFVIDGDINKTIDIIERLSNSLAKRIKYDLKLKKKKRRNSDD